jgi:hypothetical protein
MKTTSITIYGDTLRLRVDIVDPTTARVHLLGPVEPLVLRKVGGRWTHPGRSPSIARNAIVRAWGKMAEEIEALATYYD